MSENKITSFEDWNNFENQTTEKDYQILVHSREWELMKDAWNACAKMKDEEIEKLMVLQTELEAKNYDLQKENESLKNQIEKMKCCGNCQRRYDGACYEYDNLCEKWSLAK